MATSDARSQNRTRIFLYLILAAAMLWAVFLLQDGQTLLFILLFASMAAVNPVVGFMELKNDGQNRTLFLFYCLHLS